MPSPMTSVWVICNKKNKEQLGIVSWNNTEKQYSFYPPDQGDSINANCLGDINNFITHLMHEKLEAMRDTVKQKIYLKESYRETEDGSKESRCCGNCFNIVIRNALSSFCVKHQVPICAVKGTCDAWDDKTQHPYLIHHPIHGNRFYNPDYGDDRMCKCGHQYDLHFTPEGCKYCSCDNFEEKIEEPIKEEQEHQIKVGDVYVKESAFGNLVNSRRVLAICDDIVFLSNVNSYRQCDPHPIVISTLEDNSNGWKKATTELLRSII